MAARAPALCAAKVLSEKKQLPEGETAEHGGDGGGGGRGEGESVGLEGCKGRVKNTRLETPRSDEPDKPSSKLSGGVRQPSWPRLTHSL
jgi:hypothetical protein